MVRSFLFIGMMALAQTGQGGDVKLENQPDGSVRVANGLMTAEVRLSPKEGVFLSWLGQGDSGHNMAVAANTYEIGGPGHVGRDIWDPIEMAGVPSGRPVQDPMMTPVACGLTANQSAAIVAHETQGPFILRKTHVFRRDYAGVEIRWEVRNVKAPAQGWALRAHSIISPGARGPGSELADDVWLPTEKGILAVDQTLARGAQNERYGDIIYYPGTWDGEPSHGWTGKPRTTRLTGDWAVRLNRQHGDGMAFLADPAQCVAWNLHPAVTIEPAFRAQTLKPDESWSTHLLVVPFTGVPGAKVARVTPLGVETELIRLDGSALVGEILPFFTGKLGVESGGDPVIQFPVAANTRFRLNREAGIRDVNDWRLVATDTAGIEIAACDLHGRWTLAPASLETKEIPKPVFKGNLVFPEDHADIMKFISTPDFTVYVTPEASDVEKEWAGKIARRLGVGVVARNPRGKLLMLGTPGNNSWIRNAGKLKNSVDENWPGPGKGAILHYPNFELTQAPVILVCGSDREGAQLAAKTFHQRFSEIAKDREGFQFWAVSPDQYIYPWSRPAMHEPLPVLRMEAAKGEYEAVQAVITAWGAVTDIEVTMDPLLHAETGLPMGKKHRTPFRLGITEQGKQPLWLRWVDYAPFPPEGGWSGNPDPLFDRPVKELQAGTSQALWLTAVIPDDAAPGLYRGRIVCRANGVEQAIPIEVTVWDFALPLTGTPGDPYMDLGLFSPDNKRTLGPWEIRSLVSNFVEHGMRWIHLGGVDLIRGHVSPEGIYKGVSLPWLEVNDDGTFALDFAKWDDVIKEADAVARPYELTYMLYAVTFQEAINEFAAKLPKRFEALPEPPTKRHFYYEREVLTLLKRHLEKQDLLRRFYLKIGDEPASLRTWYRDLCRPADEAGLPFMTAMNQFPIEEAEELLRTNIGMFKPLYLAFRPEFIAKARQAGKRIAWYNCGPPPHIAVTTPVPEIRSYIWQAAKYELDSVSWWGIQNWRSGHVNAWKDYYEHHNQVVYPEHPMKSRWLKPGGGWKDCAPIDSLRWEHIRDGMEDSAYIKALRDAVAAARARGADREAAAGQAVLEGIWSTLYPDLTQFRPSYDELMAARRGLAAAIIRLQTPLGSPHAVPGSAVPY